MHTTIINIVKLPNTDESRASSFVKLYHIVSLSRNRPNFCQTTKILAKKKLAMTTLRYNREILDVKDIDTMQSKLT